MEILKKIWFQFFNGYVREKLNSLFKLSFTCIFLLALFTSNVTEAGTITSTTTGDWNTPGTWVGGVVPGATDDVVIASGHIVTCDAASYCLSLNIAGTITVNQAFILYILGDLIFDSGDWTGTKGDIYMLGADAAITGTAIITTTADLRIEAGTKIIPDTADLDIENIRFLLRPSGNITNYGTVICKKINAVDNSSTWTNGTGGSLICDRGILEGVEKGILDATATNNSVTYRGEIDELLYATTYYNLIIDAGTKIVTLNNDITVSNDLTISAGTLDVNSTENYGITLAGDWSNTGGTFNENSGTVILNGTTTQSISAETFYSVTVNKSAGDFLLTGDVTVSNTLTMTSGDIDAMTNSRTLSLGNSTPTQGILSRSSGGIKGTFKRWITATGADLLFPVKTGSSYYGATLNYTNLTAGSMQVSFLQVEPDSNMTNLNESSVDIIDRFKEGYWELTAADGLVSNNYNIEVEANPTLFNDYTITAATRLLYRANIGVAYTLAGSHQSSSNNIIYRNSLTAASGVITVGHTACVPPVIDAIEGSATACTDASNEPYKIATPNPTSTYTWTITGGSQSYGGTADSITVDWNSVGGSWLVSVVENESGGCSPSEAKEKDVTLNPLELTITGATQVCSNETESYSVSNTSGSTYTWVITGGTQASGGTTNSITVDWAGGGTGSVKVTETSASCGDGTQETLVVSIDFLTANTGDWDVGATWVGGSVPSSTDCATLLSGHIVTMTQAEYINNLTIASGATLNDAGNKLYVSGDISFNGDWTGGGQIWLSGDGTTIDGTASISTSNVLFILTGTKTIKSTANLSLSLTRIAVSANGILVNNGDITCYKITGQDASCVWTQSENSTLSTDQKVFGIGKGTLNASATGNTINYIGTGFTGLIFPTTYYNLGIDKTGKTPVLEGNILVKNDLTITNGTLSTDGTDNYSITLGGNWSNSGTFNENSSTITLNGTSDQSISNGSGEQFYNLVINKASGTVNLSDAIIASNELTLTSGNISTSTNKVTLGTSTVNIGTLNLTSGVIIGKFERWANATGTNITFPLGTATNTNTMVVNFTNLGTSGSLLAEFISGDPGSVNMPYTDGTADVSNQFTEGYWSTTANNSLASNDFDINLTANGFTSYTISSPTRLCTRVNAAGGWIVDGTHATAIGNVVYRTGVGTATREYGVGDSDCNPPTTSAITGDSDVCISDAAESYQVTPTIGSTYAWTITGGTVSYGAGTDSITVDWGSTGMTDGDVQVVETIACGEGSPVNLAVEIGPTTDTIVGAMQVGENSSGKSYTVTDISGSSYGWKILGGTQASGGTTNSITVDWGNAGAGKVSVVETDAVCGAGDSVHLAVTKLSTIISNASGDWTNTGTWIGGVVPGSDNNVEISSGHTITMDGNPGACNGIVIKGTALWTLNGITTNVGDDGIDINSGGDITDINKTGILTTTGDLVVNATTNGTKVKVVMQTTGDQTISGSGSLANLQIDATTTNNGTLEVSTALSGISTLTNAANKSLTLGGTSSISGLDASASGNTITYNGTAEQTISNVSSFYNLTIDNSTTATLSSATDVNNVLTLNQGTLALESTLTLVSTASSTASLTQIVSGSITGNLEVQRYISPAGGGWRDITSPIAGSTIANWMPGILTSGFTGSTQPTSGFVSMYFYDEALDTSPSLGWVAATSTTNSTTSRGVSTYFGSEVGTISVTGTPNQGTQVFNSSSSPAITYTNNDADNGLNYIGNPYPCNIDWNLIDAGDKVSIDNKIWIWNATSGNFGVYDGDLDAGTEGVNNIIPSSQGFWIYATSDPTLTIRESDKTLTSTTFIKSLGYDNSMLKLGVTSDINSFSNEAIVAITTNSSENAIDDSDVEIFPSFESAAPNIFTHSSDNVKLTINEVPDNVASLIVPLDVQPATDYWGTVLPGNYTIDVKKMDMPTEASVYLLDKTLGTYTDIKSTPTYTFNISNTVPDPRFELHFNVILTEEEQEKEKMVDLNPAIKLSPNPLSNTSELCFPNPNNNRTSITILNEMGQVVRSYNDVFSNSIKIEKGNLSSGYYVVSIATKGQSKEQVSLVVL